MAFSSATATSNSTVLGLPGSPIGQTPNLHPNNNQTIYTNEFAVNGILSMTAGLFVAPGSFVSKLNDNPNDVTFGLPTTASVVAGNLWIVTEGLVPDTLNMDSIQGDSNGQPPFFSTGMAVNVIPFPEIGTVMNAWVFYATSATPAINSALYVRNDGALTINPADSAITSAAYTVGYVVQTTLTTVAAGGFFQVQVVINPRYVLQP